MVQFSTAEDRDYYVKQDPVHKAFIRGLDESIEKTQVIDFIDCVYREVVSWLVTFWCLLVCKDAWGIF